MNEGNQFSEKKIKKFIPATSHIEQFYLPTLLIIGLILILYISTIRPSTGSKIVIPGENILEIAVGYTVLACELIAVLVIGVAAIQALIKYIQFLFRRLPLTQQISSTEAIRLQLGHILSLGLEFAVAADILRLAISSASVADLLVLFAIILLRILLNYFLEHDIHSIREYNLVPELTPLEISDDSSDSNQATN